MNTRFIGATLLLAGISIGGAMLALPVITAIYGFVVATILFVIAWAYLTFTALLILEINLWMPEGSNFIFMANKTLGKVGGAITWLSYLLLFYSLLAAYITGLSGLTVSDASYYFHIHTYPWIASIITIILFSVIIYLGTRCVDMLNRLFMVGLIITYILLCILVTPHATHLDLHYIDLHAWWLALPIVTTAFGSHIVIPSMRTYLQGNVKLLRWAIILGSTITLLVYLFWEALILGSLPIKDSSYSLHAILLSGQPQVGLANALSVLLHNSWVGDGFRWFALLAICTSLLGVAFSLFDFLSDGFNIKKTHGGKLMTATLTFLPPFIYALFYPKGFVLALSYAGAIVAILLGILPASMAWWGRYKLSLAEQAHYRVHGGRIMLLLVGFFSLLVIMSQFASVFKFSL
ncbi:MAG: hypothetical protein JKY13_02725 [Gammaproteobacteria bacterium]|nr:hypothetical protein [Gammaproteobacteria bacterium]